MLSGIHFLLTYECNYECDHCFLYCGPKSTGTFKIKQIRDVLEDALSIKTLEWIYFEGGEPFLYYPILVEACKTAKEMGFKVGIITNTYWATSVEDAKIWLNPFKKIEIDDFSISDDIFHYEEGQDNLAKNAFKALKDVSLQTTSISIEEPTIEFRREEHGEKGEPVVGGETLFKGRAVEKLTNDLPKRPWRDMNECPHEDLKELGRVHLDPFGNVQVCQGLSLGNFFKRKLSEIIETYDPSTHPIINPLLKGGPAELVKHFGISHDDSYVDECHLCYRSRLALLDKYPDYLCPRQVYGL
jgi:MoaA/NifB/PqqE/SkfB family radical SAM enzyme